MNQDHPSPDETPQPADDTLQRLEEIEQRLQTARPRPPELDLAAIMRTAHEVDLPVELADHSSNRRGHRSYRWVGTVAGSWACGAIVGALVTLAVLSWSQPSEDLQDSIATTTQELPQVTAPVVDTKVDEALEQPQPAVPRPPSWSRSEWLVSATLSDPHGRNGADYGTIWPPLQAGVFTRGRTASESWHFRNSSVMRQDWNDTSHSESTLDSEPEPTTTRELLLEELLGVDPDSIL